jgi:uncharacterized membrane protein YbjE (DUF340 family)
VPRAAGHHVDPGLVRRSRSTALGLCGATSMDFTLPVLQRSGGVEIVPAAIVHGFLLSLLVPILIAFFPPDTAGGSFLPPNLR